MGTLQMHPVVFLGPSAPASEILAILPDAVLRPPARRGDLYAYRILKHEFFLILDGAFGNTLAISPREVVDVARDGGVVVGASSMGALRAADCFPAGVQGVGLIFRLFRGRAISSEDEVAVLFHEDVPFPPVTEPLINMRVALRRATRKGLVAASEAAKIISAAQSVHFSVRTWPRVFKEAGCHLSSEMLDFLKNIDAKRADAVRAARRVSRLRQAGGEPLRRSGSSHLFGLRGNGRQHLGDALGGADRQQIEPEFFEWLVCSGRARRWLRDKIDAVSGEVTVPAPSVWRILEGAGELDAELMRFNVFRRAVSEARRCGLRPSIEDVRQAERQLADAHGAGSWNDLLVDKGQASPFFGRLRMHLAQLALTKCLRRTLLFAPRKPKTSRQVLLWKPK